MTNFGALSIESVRAHFGKIPKHIPQNGFKGPGSYFIKKIRHNPSIVNVIFSGLLKHCEEGKLYINMANLRNVINVLFKNA